MHQKHHKKNWSYERANETMRKSNHGGWPERLYKAICRFQCPMLLTTDSVVDGQMDNSSHRTWQTWALRTL